MRIAIIGAGEIGTILAQRLSEVGHEVIIANSQAPETVPHAALISGAQAVWVSEIPLSSEVIITAVPFAKVPEVAKSVRKAPTGTILIDTSNYYPLRDGSITTIEGGQIESHWVGRHYERPIAKAWNAITSQSLASKATETGDPERIAIPVAADDEYMKTVAMSLVEDTGFDAYDAGELSESWRQQPGNPAYCTDLTIFELSNALARADAKHAPIRRDIGWTAVADRIKADGALRDDYIVNLNRVLY